jgi:hypothetical protein
MHDASPTCSLSLAEPVSEDLFRYLLDLEVEKAARLRYRVSVISVVPDVPVLSPELAWHVARVTLRHLRRTDQATTFPDGTVAFMLIDAELAAAPRILGRAAGGTARGSPRFAYRGETLSVSGGAACYPLTGSSAADVLRQAIGLMWLARERGGDALLLQPPDRLRPI